MTIKRACGASRLSFVGPFYRHWLPVGSRSSTAPPESGPVARPAVATGGASALRRTSAPCGLHPPAVCVGGAGCSGGTPRCRALCTPVSTAGLRPRADGRTRRHFADASLVGTRCSTWS